MRNERANDSIPTDPFRGTIQRWSLDTGPLAGTTCDLAYNEDWSLGWRMVAGPRQGQLGRARQFMMKPVRSMFYLVWFPVTPGVFVTATVDFANRRVDGFQYDDGGCHSFGGSLRVL